MIGKTVIPLIDLVLLTLGSVLAAMTQMQRVEAIPVGIAEVGAGATVQREGFEVVTLARDGVHVGGRRVDGERLSALVAGKRVVLRAEKTLPTRRTLEILAEISRTARRTAVEVRTGREP